MEKNTSFHTVRGYQLLNQNHELLTSAMEDYLEMIYRSIAETGYMRINTLSEMLNVRPSSATKMVQKLTEAGFLKYEKYGIIFLTEMGKEKGKFLLRRHNIIEKFLSSIGISENLLTETELIEHNISSSTLSSIDILNKFFDSNENLLGSFKEFKSAYLKKGREEVE